MPEPPVCVCVCAYAARGYLNLLGPARSLAALLCENSISAIFCVVPCRTFFPTLSLRPPPRASENDQRAATMAGKHAVTLPNGGGMGEEGRGALIGNTQTQQHSTAPSMGVCVF